MDSEAPDRDRDRLDLSGGVAAGACASGDTLKAAAEQAGKAEILDR